MGSLRTLALFFLLTGSAPGLFAKQSSKQAYPQLLQQAGDVQTLVPDTAAGPYKPKHDAGASSAGAGSAVMLQGFHWESHQAYPWWNVVASKAGDISSSGIDMVWLPPSSEAQSDEGYLPSRLYVQTSHYGTQDQLKGAVSALHGRGVKALADIVINHRVGTKGWADFEEPAWGPEAVVSGDEWPGAKGHPDTGKGFHAGRDIDHTNAAVQKSLNNWLLWMKSEIGYDGWRYDFVRGFGSRYLSAYNDATSPSFAVAEVWDDFDINNANAHRQQLCDWIDSTGGRVAAFDFTTKAVLQHAVSAGEYWRLGDKDGKPSGLIGWWPAKAVTFLDNHDTGASSGGSGGQNAWPFPGDKILQGYAYIMTHPGVPCLYWPHFYDWGIHDQLNALIQARKAAGVNATSSVSIQAADTSKYAAIVGGKLAVKIGPGDWSPGAGWELAAYGKDYAVWTK
ncbi:MAG: alpha-amylase [Elusimicrobia bacterium]|nr:alpha-amylase [Elusimicrobiota bacterium]